MTLFDYVLTKKMGGGGGGGGGNLPDIPPLDSAYQQVEYIHFDGSSYLTVPASNIPVWVGVMYLDIEQDSLDSNSIAIGFRENASTSDLDWNFGKTNAGQRWYNRGHIYLNGDGTGSYGQEVVPVGNRIRTKAELYLGDNPFYIGCYFPKAAATAGLPFTGRIYSVNIIKGIQNVWVMCFLPCYRKSDDVVGMYDVINSVFYTNDGTGTLTPGPNV